MNVSPSSFIFVAVIAIWAVYLVVHVSRRREYLATARTVDRFSSQMRVLERRAATYTPPATSSRVSSASLSRPRPLVAAGTPDLLGAAAPASDVSSAGLPGGADGHDAAGERPRGEAGSAVAVASAQPVAPAAAARVEPVAEGVAPGAAPAAGRSRRRLRAAALVATLAATLVTAALAGLSLVSWLVPAVMLLLVGVTVVGLRRAVVAERAARRRRVAAARRERENEARLAREAALEARPSAPSLPVAQEYVPAAPETPRVLSAESRALAAQDDATASMPTVTRRRFAATTEVFDRLYGEPAWEPTPVPAPTYTLKARAERPLPPPLDVPVPIEVDSDDVFFGDEYGRPRAVNG